MKRQRRFQTGCFILAILIGMTGMFFENTRAHSLPCCALLDAPVMDCLFAAPATGDTQVCRTELLRGQDTMHMRQSGELLRTPAVLPGDAYLFTDKGAFAGNVEIRLSHSSLKEPVIIYIHKSDGKKRG